MKTLFYFTDTHLDEPGPGEHGADAHKNWNEILSELSQRDCDAVVFGGDIGAGSAHQEFFKLLSGKQLFLTPGNHDNPQQIKAYLSGSADGAELYSSHEDADLKWLFLDSSSEMISDEQLAWLKSELNATAKPVLLFMHHPVLSVDSPIDGKYPLENRAAVKDLLLAHGKPVTIFCGHYHIEDKSALHNITQYISPAVSYQIQKGTETVQGDASYFGYRMIYIDRDDIQTETIILYPDDF